MVYPPRHYDQVFKPRARNRRESWLIALGAVLVAAVLAVTLISLSSREGTSGHGCLNFTYAIAVGGEQFHECGAAARHTCARPPKLGGLADGLLDRLPAECRKAGLAYRPRH